MQKEHRDDDTGINEHEHRIKNFISNTVTPTLVDDTNIAFYLPLTFAFLSTAFLWGHSLTDVDIRKQAEQSECRAPGVVFI